MKITRQEFEKIFRRTNASWSYEDAELNDEEKELIWKRLNEEITDEEFNRALLEKKSKRPGAKTSGEENP
ncbi:hypothetical protein [Paenibacillus tyrfis]|uniref:hypothetical protein n=1 Tax=Paenibacillus tyrfis TaxID=1501230 RepID=UPI00209EB3B1|nr:hypothetical protein [Paenibacillus tyrfis]MCP1311902.1 hypothetical protein [Paenibacillus tyrfis]